MEKEDQQDQIEKLERENQALIAELTKLKGKPKNNISYILLMLGFIVITLSILYSHNVATFIGVSLTFWGALLIYIRPKQFIRKEILNSTVTESSETYNKLLRELGYEGKAQHISPSNLWGLRNVVLYIPRSNQTPIPTDEKLSADEAVINNPQGIKLTPPGLGLSRLIENELNADFSAMELKDLQSKLEKALVEDLEIIEDLKMEISAQKVHIEMKETIFDHAIQGQNIEEIKYISDPLNSAIACILARSTRKSVVIEKIDIAPKEKTIKTDFKLLKQSE